MVNKKQKILVAMSGGVDSSVAAALLVKAGYDVTGAYMVNFDAKQNALYNDSQLNLECWRNDYRDALRVSAKLGIPLLKLDFTKEYSDFVLDYMFQEYEAGRTPNPDILCNKFIKFGFWFDKARELGFDKLATGHYAKVTSHESHNTRQASDQRLMNNDQEKKIIINHYSLIIPKDQEKDQTYFLHQLNQEQLSHTLFPLGKYTKAEVRRLAKKFGLATAEKEESMGICFVGEVPMAQFLQKRIKPTPGKIVSSSGEVIGEHQGLAFYTIGQRHFGLQTTDYGRDKSKVQSPKSDRGENEPLYILDKRIGTNELVVGYEDDPLLYKKTVPVKEVNWIAGRAPDFPLKCKVRLRHRQSLQSATLVSEAGGVSCLMETAQRAVTPGQFAVFYLKNTCLGGGVIC